MRDQQQQFKRFFGCSFLSDFTLHISSEPPLTIARDRNDCSQGPGGSEQEPLLPGPSVGEASNGGSSGSISAAAGGGDAGLPISLPVHGVVLAAASPYFDTLLRDWKSSSNTLHMVVGEDQVAAAQVLVGFLYTSAVPANLSQHDLLQLLLLADRFDVRRAAAAASRVLGCLSPAALEWSTLTGIWALPDHLFEADEQEPLRVVAWDRLMQLFGDLEDSWATADGRLLWQQLPLRAVTALVASDALAVASENTVFAALASWIAHAQAGGSGAGGHGGSKQLAAHDMKVLAASLRLPGMGPTFLSYVALQHDWFRQATDVMALARAAAFAAASPEVRKDIAAHTAATSTAVLAAAAASAATGGGAAGAADSGGSGCSPCGRPSSCICGGLLEVGGSSAGSSSTSSAGGGGAPAGGSGSGLMSRCICGLGVSPEQKAQLLALAQASQRPRAVSCQRSCCFPWHVDLAAVKQLHDEVAAAGSRDSRILRSPAHSFAGYEWALQLEITQTRGATGFDGSKPWALGVFLTCQVRVEVPARAAEQPPAAAGAAVGSGSAVFGAGGSDSAGSSSSSSGGAGAGRGAADGPAAVCFPGGGAAACKAAAAGPSSSSSQQPPLTLQLVDFGFVSTAATIAVREVGGARDKRCEKSWEHAVVRYRASWGWPNYLDVQCTGWDESVFERWVVDGQMHLTANVRVLG